MCRAALDTLLTRSGEVEAVSDAEAAAAQRRAQIHRRVDLARIHRASRRKLILRRSALMPIRHPQLLRRDDCLLLLVDLQAPFLSGITERDRVIARCELLARACDILGVPTILTVQYAEKMGGVIPQIHDAAPNALGEAPLDKLCFSCAGSEDFIELLSSSEPPPNTDRRRGDAHLCRPKPRWI